ncbi:MAG: hypothetical protein K6D54_01400 [Bacteroidales bacterium]|nr:hypothetical protein [Bacteroidales bacterium]
MKIKIALFCLLLMIGAVSVLSRGNQAIATNEGLLRRNIDALMETEIYTTFEPCAWNPQTYCLFPYVLNGVEIIERVDDVMKISR